VKALCHILKVTSSGYYAYCKRNPNGPDNAEYKELLYLVKQVDKSSGNTYGRRRMAKALWALGFNMSEDKAAKLMAEAGVKVKYQKKHKVTTNSNHKKPLFENLLNRKFDVSIPDQYYAGDITYIRTQEGWLYLAVVIDLYSRKVVGWSMSSRMKSQLVCDALKMAIWQRQPKAGLIHHSDRGSQYASHDLRRLLKANDFKGSMSRKGDCWGNSVVESFFGSMKQERVQWQNYQTRYEAQQDILKYITMYYNSQRLHSYLGYKSPIQYEQEMAELKKAA
jgi:transposase InsO family protein